MSAAYEKALRRRNPFALSRAEWAETHGEDRRNLLHLAADAGGADFRAALVAYGAVQGANSGLNLEPHVVMDARGFPPLHLAARRLPLGDDSGVRAWLEVWPHGTELGIRGSGTYETVLHYIAWWSSAGIAREYCRALTGIYTSVHTDAPAGGRRAVQLAAERLDQYCAAKDPCAVAIANAADVFGTIARSAAEHGVEWVLLEDTHLPSNFVVNRFEDGPRVAAALAANPQHLQHGSAVHAGSCNWCSPRVQLATAREFPPHAKRLEAIELINTLTARYRAQRGPNQ